MRISLPAFYGAPYLAPERFPVLIVLDASAELPFTAIAATARTLAEGTNTPAMPPLIIVGVETPNPSRFRDLTPPPVRPFVPSAGFPNPGGAPAFLRFLSEELRPYIAAQYRTQSATFLAGHSLSGSFAAWAFGHAPEFLTGAIALSPTPGWLTDDALAGRQVLDGIAARTRPGRLFLATVSAVALSRRWGPIVRRSAASPPRFGPGARVCADSRGGACTHPGTARHDAWIAVHFLALSRFPATSSSMKTVKIVWRSSARSSTAPGKSFCEALASSDCRNDFR